MMQLVTAVISSKSGAKFATATPIVHCCSEQTRHILPALDSFSEGMDLQMAASTEEEQTTAHFTWCLIITPQVEHIATPRVPSMHLVWCGPLGDLCRKRRGHNIAWPTRLGVCIMHSLLFRPPVFLHVTLKVGSGLGTRLHHA